IDIPYLALVVWAAALEVGRPRRGLPVFLLLTAAALLRPEAWILIGLYWLWFAWRAPWRARFGYAALTAVGPLAWAFLDWRVTGDPLFSLHHTGDTAEELGRATGLAAVPSSTQEFLVRLDKLPVVLGGIAGAALAVWCPPCGTSCASAPCATACAAARCRRPPISSSPTCGGWPTSGRGGWSPARMPRGRPGAPRSAAWPSW